MEQTAIETITKIQQAAKPMQDVRIISEMKIGEVGRQGDIYLLRVKEVEGKGKAIKSRQLAPGTSKGSRHIVEDKDSVQIWESSPSLRNHASFQFGPAIEAKESFLVSHPEHAFIKFPAGCYQVFFQADFNRKERARD